VLRAASIGPVRSRSQGQAERQILGQEWNHGLGQLQRERQLQREGLGQRQAQAQGEDQGFRRRGTMGGYGGETGRDRLAELRRLERRRVEA
jgi:hypothetical protein